MSEQTKIDTRRNAEALKAYNDQLDAEARRGE